MINVNSPKIHAQEGNKAFKKKESEFVCRKAF